MQTINTMLGSLKCSVLVFSYYTHFQLYSAHALSVGHVHFRIPAKMKILWSIILQNGFNIIQKKKLPRCVIDDDCVSWATQSSSGALVIAVRGCGNDGAGVSPCWLYVLIYM